MMKKMKQLVFVFSLFFCSVIVAESMESELTVIDEDVFVEPASSLAFGAMHSAINNYSIGTSPLILSRLFPPSMIMRNQEKLGLSEKQIEQIKKEMRAFQSGIVDIQWDLHAATSALEKETDESKIDIKRALSLVDRVLIAENKMKKSHLALLIKIRNILDEKQIMKIKRSFALPVGAIDISAVGTDFIWNEDLEVF